jgi:holliday junction DNA helicase RuvB
MHQKTNLFSTNTISQEKHEETTLRPLRLDQFVGQEKIKSNLKVSIDAAKIRSAALDHIIFYGPPGLGKTTLSQIIASEMGVQIKSTSGPAITKAGELAAILSNLKPFDVLFIDEIHRMSKSVEELLYSAMEDFQLDIIIGEGPTARIVKIKLPKFTLVAATTRLGLLSKPLKDRFGIPLKLDFYNEAELTHIVQITAKKLNMRFNDDAAVRIARCSRGTPRIANRLVKRISDFTIIQGIELVNLEFVQNTFSSLGIDENGLDNMDFKYMRYILDNFAGGPVGIETIAAGLCEDKGTIEDVIEPYLMNIGFVNRTSKGRILSKSCMDYLTCL